MSSTNNIWIVSNSMSGGGAERASNLLANLLFDQSLAVVQIHLNKSPIDLVRNRCPVICLERDKNGNIISLFKLAIKFGFLSRKFPISYMILNCELPELVSLFSSRRIRKIVVEHADPSWVGRRALGILVRKLLFKLHRADFVAVLELVISTSKLFQI
jgi:hypothetical protein